jgi:hypothetical protein
MSSSYNGLPFYPVDGALDSAGAVIALYPLMESYPTPSLAAITPPSYASSGVTLTGFQTEMAAVSLSAVVSMGFSSLASISGSGTSVFILQDFITYGLAPVSNAAGPIAGWVYGAGLRVVGRGLNVQGSAITNIQSLAASGTLNLAQTAFEFTTIGLPLSIGVPLTSSLIVQSMQGLSLETMAAIGEAQAAISDAIDTNPAAVTPEVIGVWFNPTNVITGLTAGYGYALRTVRGGNAPGNIMQAKPPKGLPAGISFDQNLVNSVATALGMSDLSQKPTSAQSSLAKSLDMP